MSPEGYYSTKELIKKILMHFQQYQSKLFCYMAVALLAWSCKQNIDEQLLVERALNLEVVKSKITEVASLSEVIIYDISDTLIVLETPMLIAGMEVPFVRDRLQIQQFRDALYKRKNKNAVLISRRTMNDSKWNYKIDLYHPNSGLLMTVKAYVRGNRFEFDRVIIGDI